MGTQKLREEELELQGQCQDIEAVLRAKRRSLDSLGHEERVVMEAARVEAEEKVNALQSISSMKVELAALKARCNTLKAELDLAGGAPFAATEEQAAAIVDRLYSIALLATSNMRHTIKGYRWSNYHTAVSTKNAADLAIRDAFTSDGVSTVRTILTQIVSSSLTQSRQSNDPNDLQELADQIAEATVEANSLAETIKA